MSSLRTTLVPLLLRAARENQWAPFLEAWCHLEEAQGVALIAFEEGATREVAAWGERIDLERTGLKRIAQSSAQWMGEEGVEQGSRISELVLGNYLWVWFVADRYRRIRLALVTLGQVPEVPAGGEDAALGADLLGAYRLVLKGHEARRLVDDGLRTALDQAGVAVIRVTESGTEPLSPFAARWLSFRSEGGTLVSSVSRVFENVQLAIHEGRTEEILGEQVITVPDSTDVVLVQVRRDVADARALLVTSVDAGLPPEVDQADFQDHFGLDEIEARVAVRLAAGEPEVQIGASLGLSEESVLRHIRALCEKTQAGSRAELVAMLRDTSRLEGKR